jgi:hypothetical protein
MKILSIDVGIRNLSFCLFEIIDSDKTKIEIIKWDNIDLTTITENKCIEVDKKGLCDKPAKFMKPNSENCYCLKHSKKQTFLHPTSDLKPSFINKQKIQCLIEIADKYKIKYDKPAKKANLVALINEFILTNCFTPVQKNNATKVDLVTIGRNIQHKFDEILCDHLQSINKIIIENQIGPIANKMKTIQGMLSQYFIMRNNNIQIDFISATNKLKDFIPTTTTTTTTNQSNKDQSQDLEQESILSIETKKTDKKDPKLDYKQRKKLGIQTTINIVNNDFRFKIWADFLHKHNKKDDLSDCFLQGMWYIKNKI